MDCHNTAYLSIAQFNYIQLVFRIYIISEYMYAHTVFSREAVKCIIFPRRIYIYIFTLYILSQAVLLFDFVLIFFGK